MRILGVVAAGVSSFHLGIDLSYPDYASASEILINCISESSGMCSADGKCELTKMPSGKHIRWTFALNLESKTGKFRRCDPDDRCASHGELTITITPMLRLSIWNRGVGN